jgi:hypothetical protein
MLSTLGIPVLRWLDETLIPQTQAVVDEFAEYVRTWRAVLDV